MICWRCHSNSVNTGSRLPRGSDVKTPMPISPTESRDLADENNKILTEWKWFETTVLWRQRQIETSNAHITYFDTHIKLLHENLKIWLQCRDNYFFKIKFVFFLYLRLSASKENDLPLCIYFWYHTDSEVPNTSIYSAV
jgi:hypothetical protein